MSLYTSFLIACDWCQQGPRGIQEKMFKNRLDNSLDQTAKLRPVINYNVVWREMTLSSSSSHIVSKHCQHMFAWNKSLEGLFCHGFLANFSNFPTVSIESSFWKFFYFRRARRDLDKNSFESKNHDFGIVAVVVLTIWLGMWKVFSAISWHLLTNYAFTFLSWHALYLRYSPGLRVF